MNEQIDVFVRLYLAGFFTFVAAFYSVRLILRRWSKKLLFVGKPGTSHFTGHLTFRIFRLTIWAICVIRVFSPSLDGYLIMIQPLNIAPVVLSGVALLFFGFLLSTSGHYALGREWTSGIDPQGPGRLVTEKLYSLSRNPMYMGVIAGQLGFFLALPSAFSLICLVIGFVAVLNQVRLEESHLSKHFPEDYENYCRRVRRWL